MRDCFSQRGSDEQALAVKKVRKQMPCVEEEADRQKNPHRAAKIDKNPRHMGANSNKDRTRDLELDHQVKTATYFRKRQPARRSPVSDTLTASTLKTGKKTVVTDRKELTVKYLDHDSRSALAIETRTTTTALIPHATFDSDVVAHTSAERTVTFAHFDELPSWMRVDPYIRRGYRRPSNSLRACFWSLFYPHNELVNTWSHLVPALFFLALLLLADYPMLHSATNVARADNWALQIYVGGTAGCLFLSVS